MRRRMAIFVRLAAATVAAAMVVGCSYKAVLDSYVLNDAYLAGDNIKGIKPIRSIVVWPITVSASGSKAKGIESKVNDIIIDKFNLKSVVMKDDFGLNREGDFQQIIIVSSDRASELLTRAAEELGLKRKPKEIDGGLIASKVGQLSGGEAIFMGNVTDYDEDKADKYIESLVTGSFYLIDAREKSYTVLDSFTPLKYLWRATTKMAVTETLANPRWTLDATMRKLIKAVVSRVIREVVNNQEVEGAANRGKVAAQVDKAESLADKGEYDKSLAAWTEVQKMDPAYPGLKAKMDEVTKAKAAAEEKKKKEAALAELESIRKEAIALEKDGKLEQAVGKWQALLAKNKEDKEAAEKIEKLKARMAKEKEQQRSQEIDKNLSQAKKAYDEGKYQDAIAAAQKVLEVDKENSKAKGIIADATKKLDELKAKEEKKLEKKEEKKEEKKPAAPESRKEEKAPAVKTEEKKASNGGGSQVEEIRKKALGYFDKEDYAKSREEWKKLLEIVPDDPQAKEMMDTTEMLMKALQ